MKESTSSYVSRKAQQRPFSCACSCLPAYKHMKRGSLRGHGTTLLTDAVQWQLPHVPATSRPNSGLASGQ